MENTIDRLVFVYNAKSGFIHGAMDLIHKKVKPSTYPCKLCQVTYRGAQMNQAWKKYVADLGVQTIFLHKDEYKRLYPDRDDSFPCILAETRSGSEILISSQEFDKITSLDSLIYQLDRKLKRHG
jgi:hypothetical protein